MRTFIKQTKAFTVLELVFVIIVIGILAAISMANMERDLRQEASDNILSAIRYTQHLALTDDKTDPFNLNWQADLWSITFAANGSSYAVASGANFAMDTSSGKAMDGTNTGSPDARIGEKYGTDGANLVFAGGCAGTTTIAFDHLGRPFDAVAGATNNYANYMNSNNDCTITITFADGSNPLVITIREETGYVSGN